MKNKQSLIGLIAVVAIWAALCVCAIFKTPTDASISERRKLAQFPKVTAENILSGKFMTEFETYSLDQFPWRDEFRTLKANGAFYLFNKSDNNGIYLVDGYASKLEYPLNENSVAGATQKFQKLFDSLIKQSGAKVYFSVAPDKNYFMAEQNGYPSIDYAKMIEMLKKNMSFAQYIDIINTLELSDYYKTDTHWRQESIIDTANSILSAMGQPDVAEHTVKSADVPFYGVYYGQSALPLPSEDINYVSNDVFDSLEVTTIDLKQESYTGFMDKNKKESNDPYEMYLSGAKAIVIVENPNSTTDKELVIFRDSFGSSIAPLLSQDYAKVTLVDTRYLMPEAVSSFTSFSRNTDVLFLYSTLILNQSSILKG